MKKANKSIPSNRCSIPRSTQRIAIRAGSSQMKQLINEPVNIVKEAVESFVATNSHLRLLQGLNVVVHKKQLADKSKVALISGGGSGHEPAHAGFIGDGMLSAAVCGEVFASPSAEMVLQAIRAVTGPSGCLLIIKNYTGDKLHFGLAAELAKAEGFKVEMVVVGDDVAIEEPSKITGRRGLAGTVLVHKVAGATAARGGSLEEVKSAALKASQAVSTLGVCLKVCTLPGKQPSDRLGEGEIEIGLGIHGEPGTVKTQTMNVDPLVERMLDQLVSSRHFGGPLVAGEGVVVLVNNLGATTPLEMCLVTRALLSLLADKYEVKVHRSYVGPLMTSLDMAGMSITLMRTSGLDPSTLDLLDLPVTAPGWTFSTPAILNPDANNPLPLTHLTDLSSTTGASEGQAKPHPPPSTAEGKSFKKAMEAAAHAIVSQAAALDAMDAKVGDGDCGSTLALGANRILVDSAARVYDYDSPAQVIKLVSESIRASMGGSSGALYDVLFTAAARSLKESTTSSSSTISLSDAAKAFKEGVEATSKYGGATIGCRTMLDALYPAAEAAQQEAAKQGASVVSVLDLAAKAAEEGAEATKAMKAQAGRSAYVSDLQGIPDPGAVAVGIWLESLAASFKN